MYILDTNVLSELIKAKPEPIVLSWVQQQQPAQLYATAITVAEMLRGVASLPSGKKKQALHQAVNDMFNEDFQQRILSFNHHAAAHYAAWVQQRQQAGRPVSQSDAQIAGIVLSAEATLVTRNSKDFAGLNAGLINPWEIPS